MTKKRIGILGGISYESTSVYYNLLHEKYFTRCGDYYYPEVVIYSLNLQKFTDFEDRDEIEAYIDYIVFGVQALKRAGVDFALLAANSPHAVFAEVEQRVNIPLLSIVDVTAREAARLGLRRLLLLGIRFTMQSTFYADACRALGMEVITPALADQDRINQIIFEELTVGQFKATSRQELLNIIAQHDVDGVILGCTELPLILHPEHAELPLLNTLDLHVEAALDFALT
jgi:aspartate racemase